VLATVRPCAAFDAENAHVTRHPTGRPRPGRRRRAADPLTQVLSAQGAVVVDAADAAEAIAAIDAAERFDVAVTEVNLPDSRDLRLARCIRQRSPATRVVVMSAFGTTALRDEARAIGARFIDKPFDLDAMADVVMGAARGA
jgi:DNA-binding NtrC family response regulator